MLRFYLLDAGKSDVVRFRRKPVTENNQVQSMVSAAAEASQAAVIAAKRCSHVQKRGTAQAHAEGERPRLQAERDG